MQNVNASAASLGISVISVRRVWRTVGLLVISLASIAPQSVSAYGIPLGEGHEPGTRIWFATESVVRAGVDSKNILFAIRMTYESDI